MLYIKTFYEEDRGTWWAILKRISLKNDDQQVAELSTTEGYLDLQKKISAAGWIDQLKP